MALTDGEKLIIAMLADQSQALALKGELNVEFILNNAHSRMWAVKAKYPGLFGDDGDENPEEVTWTHKVLSMWSVVERSFEALSEEDKGRVLAAPGSFGNAPRFGGFDGHTGFATIARIIVDELGDYDWFSGRPLDSHMPDVEVHGRMLDKYREVQDRGGGMWGSLDADRLIEVLRARIHPSQRQA